MTYLNDRKGKKCFMAIKVDMAKAYDKVEWATLIHIMTLHGFSESFCLMLMVCMTTVKYSVLLNGSPCGFFTASRGIRQGDPISPALFVILVDLLSRILLKAENDGSIRGIKISRGSPRITHLMYADDLIIYGHATLEEARAIGDCLHTNSSWTGQSMNLGKSSIHFSSNTPFSLKGEICTLLGIRECTHQTMHLGMPFCRFKSRKVAAQHLLEKLTHKLTGWKKCLLSSAGSAVLIKSVALAVPSYVMQMCLLPIGVCQQMDRMIRSFWWGGESKDRRLHLKAWDALCKPKCSGGLGFRRFRDINIAFITKIGWQFCTDSHRPWVQLVRAKYLRGRRIIDFQHKTQASSWLWSGICHCYGSLRRGLCIQIGRNSVT